MAIEIEPKIEKHLRIRRTVTVEYDVPLSSYTQEDGHSTLRPMTEDEAIQFEIGLEGYERWDAVSMVFENEPDEQFKPDWSVTVKVIDKEVK